MGRVTRDPVVWDEDRIDLSISVRVDGQVVGALIGTICPYEEPGSPIREYRWRSLDPRFARLALPLPSWYDRAEWETVRDAIQRVLEPAHVSA